MRHEFKEIEESVGYDGIQSGVVRFDHEDLSRISVSICLKRTIV